MNKTAAYNNGYYDALSRMGIQQNKTAGLVDFLRSAFRIGKKVAPEVAAPAAAASAAASAATPAAETAARATRAIPKARGAKPGYAREGYTADELIEMAAKKDQEFKATAAQAANAAGAGVPAGAKPMNPWLSHGLAAGAGLGGGYLLLGRKSPVPPQNYYGPDPGYPEPAAMYQQGMPYQPY